MALKRPSLLSRLALLLIATLGAARLYADNGQALALLNQGRVDEAQALAGRLLPRSAARGHRLLAQIAQKKNDPATAETEFKSAIAAAKSPDAWIDLAIFYQHHSQPDKALATVQTSVESNRQ